jgi:hypothetical protein
LTCWRGWLQPLFGVNMFTLIMRQLITHSTSTIMLIGGRTNLLGTCDCQTDPIGWDCLWSGRGIWGSSTTSSRPERLRHHPILLHQLSGPRGYTHFPQLHLDATLNAGDVPIAPTSSLWRGVGCIQGKRPTAVFYTCRHVESLVQSRIGGRVNGGAFDGVPTDSLYEFD